MLINLVDVIDEYSAGVIARRYVMPARVPQALVQRGAAFTVRAGGRHLATNNHGVVQHPSTDQYLSIVRHAEPCKATESVAVVPQCRCSDSRCPVVPCRQQWRRAPGEWATTSCRTRSQRSLQTSVAADSPTRTNTINVCTCLHVHVQNQLTSHS